MTSKQVTLPPWNSRKLVHSKDTVWAWRWSVALRTFYRQILSLLYSSFFFFLLSCTYIQGEHGWTNWNHNMGGPLKPWTRAEFSVRFDLRCRSIYQTKIRVYFGSKVSNEPGNVVGTFPQKVPWQIEEKHTLNRRKGYKYSLQKSNYPRGSPQKTIQTRLSQQALCFSLLRLCESLFLRPAGGFGLGSQAANVWFVWKVSGKDEKFTKGKLCGKLFCRHSQKIPFITRSRWWWID